MFPSPKTGRCCTRPIRDSWNRKPSIGKARRHFPREVLICTTAARDTGPACGVSTVTFRRLPAHCTRRAEAEKSVSLALRPRFFRPGVSADECWGNRLPSIHHRSPTSTRISCYLDVDTRAKPGPMLQDPLSCVAQTSHRLGDLRKRQSFHDLVILSGNFSVTKNTTCTRMNHDIRGII